MDITEYLLSDRKVDWKKLREKRDRVEDTSKELDSILNYLKEDGKCSDFLGMNCLILFTPDDWDKNPYHTEGESHWYFTEEGIGEARRYVRDFKKFKGVRICKPIEIIR